MAALQNCRKALYAWTALVAFAAPCAAQIDPKTALLERAGWEALTAGRAHAAAEAFRDAIAADPKNARLHLGAGMAATLERRDADALDAVQRALALDPRLVEARALLGQIQYRLGDAAAAIRTYEGLVAAAPDDRGAQATLARWQREAALHDRMRQAIGANFTVSFEGPAEEALASEALASLDRAYWRIGQLLGTYPSAPIPVVLYSSEQFHDITRSPAWAAGAYDASFVCRWAERSTSAASWIACSRTSSRTRSCAAWQPPACLPG
jgi:tetratricopeptide (TPR) repeat protein